MTVLSWLVLKDAVSVAGVRGLRFKPDVLPTVNQERGLTVTFWLKVEQFVNDWDILFHCGSDPHRTPAAWFHGQSTRVHSRLSTTTNWNEGSDSRGNVFEINTWQHGAYIQQGNELAFYVDGLTVVAYILCWGALCTQMEHTHSFLAMMANILPAVGSSNMCDSIIMPWIHKV